MKIIFAGTPDFAASHLQALIDSPHQVVAVLTQPDRPAGRGRKLQASPVKQLAEKHGITVHQPHRLKPSKNSSAEDIEQINHAIETIDAYQADFMIVVAYGLILPTTVLNLPKNGCLNVHASILPRWRGSAPIQRAIEAGDNISGVSIMQMDAGLDTGDVLKINETAIAETDTGGSLHDRLAQLGCQSLLEVLNDYANLSANKQDDSLATYAHKLSKEECQINWQDDGKHIVDKIRAFNPWPICFTQLNDEKLRIWQAKFIDDDYASSKNTGEIIKIDKQGIYVQTGKGQIILQSLQKSGSKAMPAQAFLNGFALKVGDRFDELTGDLASDKKESGGNID